MDRENISIPLASQTAEEGDLGPIYGFQWRHFGAEYKTCHDDYSGQGVDQLAQVIEGIKTDPYGRRHIMTAWNPSALPDMALPPCHFVVQFYVSSKNELSCHLNQRSCDMGLGVPFNIFSYATLARMVAQVTGTTAKELIYTLGDAHVYLDHIEPLQEQIKRVPPPFPTMTLNQNITCIDDFTMNDFVINGYNPQKSNQDAHECLKPYQWFKISITIIEMEKIVFPGHPLNPINQGPYKSSFLNTVVLEGTVDMMEAVDIKPVNKGPEMSRLMTAAGTQVLTGARDLPKTAAEALLVKDILIKSRDAKMGYTGLELKTIAYSLRKDNPRAIPVSNVPKKKLVNSILAFIDPTLAQLD